MKEKKHKYERRKEVKDKTRNNNFAAALDYLKRQSKEKLYQKDLAVLLGVTENTISNIIHYRTAVSEDMITQLQTISGCVFNLQWLRGQSNVMLAKDVPADPLPDSNAQLPIVKDESIATLKRELAAKDAIIAAKDDLIALLQQQIAELRNSNKVHG